MTTPSSPSIGAQLAAEIDARRDDLVALTQDLIRIPTVNPPGNNYREVCDYLAKRLKKNGYTVEMIRAEGAVGDIDKYPHWTLLPRREGKAPG